VNLAVDVGELLLHVTAGVADALVVDGWPQLAQEEIEQPVRTEVADRIVELGVECRFTARSTRARRSSDSRMRMEVECTPPRSPVQGTPIRAPTSGASLSSNHGKTL